MPKLNKTIETNVVEQIKSAVIIALVVGIAAFILGMQYVAESGITVDNHINVQAQDVDAENNASKK